VVAAVAQRLRLPTVPAYLITGMLIGPGAFKLISDPASVKDISDLAIILLLFGIGLHMDLSVLRDTLRRAIIATVLMTVICTGALWPVGMVMGLSTPSTIAVGIALSISSTVVVLRILQDRRELNKAEGRLSVALLVIQDLVAIAMLLVLPPLATWNGTGTAGMVSSTMTLTASGVFIEMAINALFALLGVAALVGFGKFILPWALEQALSSGQVGAALAWLPERLPPDALRRLQLAAQAHDGPVFLFRGLAARTRPSAAPLRLALQPAGADVLSVQVFKRRGPALAQPLRLELPPVLPPALRQRADALARARVRARPRAAARTPLVA
ncbi:MAG: cation:proton antiporter, partial [Rubrivivax sp.]